MTLLFFIPFVFTPAYLFLIADGYRCVHMALLQKRYFLFVLSLNKTASSGWLFIDRPMQNNEYALNNSSFRKAAREGIPMSLLK
ncbi:hypothetical protein ECA1940 [Pectobacterium atrosepticum SCRI1043]|uniref:Uncharacterized protein n=1 Tax=Pectobacterium atrosepticum (strain SCRI 1043 / ATCC BAA-672) TaxID=218491 RepID=Q6D5U8_PECAS|nr:hypothetical protein ECA1940 [Pectobacterium atrosepticum SCRI1043]